MHYICMLGRTAIPHPSPGPCLSAKRLIQGPVSRKDVSPSSSKTIYGLQPSEVLGHIGVRDASARQEQQRGTRALDVAPCIQSCVQDRLFSWSLGQEHRGVTPLHPGFTESCQGRVSVM